MKTITKLLLIVIIGITFSGVTILGQEGTSNATKPVERTKVLTAEQLAIIKANRTKQIEFRKAFKETLSEEQLETLTNPRLVREDRIKSFRASLSDNQVNMIKSNRKNIKMQHIALRSSLNEKQKMQLRRMAVNRFQHNRMMYMRARLRNRLHKI